MKRLAFLTIAIMLVPALNLRADEPRPNPSRAVITAPGQPVNVWGQGKTPAQWYIESLDPVVNLTAEQKKAITEIIENRDKKMREFQSASTEKLAAASKAMTEAFQKNDKEAIAKAQKAYQEAYAPIHQAMKESQKRLDDMLTPQQKEKQFDNQAATWIKALAGPIELSAEQKEKAKAACREMRKAADHEGMERRMPDIMDKILTPEQQAKLKKFRLDSWVKMPLNGRIKLSDEQQKKIDALLDSMAKDPNVKADWQTYQKVQPKVQEILTTEQKETLKKPMQVWGQAGGGFAAPGAAQVRTDQYWLGLSVAPLEPAERKKLDVPADQGLTVLAAVPESPAAKAGIKVHDVLLKAGERPLKDTQDLMQAVQQAKESNLALEVIRDGKKQTITVKPAKRAGEGVFSFQIGGDGLKLEGVPGGKKPAQQPTIRRLPGGGLEVIIGEGSEGAERKAEGAALREARKELEKAVAAAKAGVGERIKRRHELAEKAWQMYQKMQALGPDKKGEAHELWEQIESLEQQLRQTFEPARGGMIFAPGTPMTGGWQMVAPGQPVPGASLRPGASSMPGAPLMLTRPDPAIQELRGQIEQLRRDVDELKARAKASAKKKRQEEK